VNVIWTTAAKSSDCTFQVIAEADKLKPTRFEVRRQIEVWLRARGLSDELFDQ
jgi:hypothetical protein